MPFLSDYIKAFPKRKTTAFHMNPTKMGGTLRGNGCRMFLPIEVIGGFHGRDGAIAGGGDDLADRLLGAVARGE